MDGVPGKCNTSSLRLLYNSIAVSDLLSLVFTSFHTCPPLPFNSPPLYPRPSLSISLTTMVAARSIPQNHLHSSSDPFDLLLRPPQDESPAQREERILAEQQAKRVSDAIDEQLRMERADLKKNQPDVKILLLGQSESGKSTTLKRRSSIIFGGCVTRTRILPTCLIIIMMSARLIQTAPTATNSFHILFSHADTFPRVPAPAHTRGLPS